MSTAPLTQPRLTFGHVVSSEWTKLATLRSTFVMSAIMVLVSVGFSALLAMSMANDPDIHEFASGSLTATTISGSVSFAQLVIGVFAALIITGEYATNMIQTTFTSAPRRLPSLAAKAALVGGVSVVLSLMSSLISWLVVSPILAGADLDAPLTEPRVLGAFVYSALYVTVVALFSLSVATIVRNSAAAIALVVGLFFVVPIAASIVTFGDIVPAHYLLSYTGDAFLRAIYNPDFRPDALLNGVLTGVWLIAPAAIAVTLLRRRDV